MRVEQIGASPLSIPLSLVWLYCIACHASVCSVMYVPPRFIFYLVSPSTTGYCCFPPRTLIPESATSPSTSRDTFSGFHVTFSRRRLSSETFPSAPSSVRPPSCFVHLHFSASLPRYERYEKEELVSGEGGDQAPGGRNVHVCARPRCLRALVSCDRPGGVCRAVLMCKCKVDPSATAWPPQTPPKRTYISARWGGSLELWRETVRG